VEKYVIEAVKRLGIDAIRPDLEKWKSEKTDELRACVYIDSKTKDALGGSISTIIRLWQLQVKHGSPDVKRHAIRRLREITRALIPDTRGKKAKDSGLRAFEVKWFYYKEIFCLYHIKNALRSTPGTFSRKITAASKNFGMPIDQIRYFWGIAQDFTVRRGSGPFTIKDMAKELTAHHFKITQQRVSNILAT